MSPRHSTMALALGATLSFSAIPSLASAQTNVTLYGVMDAGVGHYRGSGRSDTLLQSGQDMPSRFGIRGSEDLGSGLSVVFKLESGVQLDTGASTGGTTFFNRESWVGVSGGFGRIVAGRVWSVTDDAWSVHRFSNFSAFIFPEFRNFDRTYANALSWVSPNLGGLVVSGVYSFGESGQGTRPSSAREIGLAWTRGPAALFATYSMTYNATAPEADKLAVLAGSYQIGPAKLRAAWVDSSPKATGINGATAVLLGVDFTPAPNWTVGVDYLRREVDDSDRGNGVARLMVNYTLSKRTSFYGYVARLTNRGNDMQSFYGAANPGASQSGLNVGMRYFF